MSQNASTSAKAAEKLLENRDALYAYVLACVRSHIDADDILQNVSVAIISSDDIPLDDSRFLAWAREVARRRVLEHFRVSRRLIPIDPETIAHITAAAERVDSNQSSRSRRESLLECLEKLPPESQQLLMARYDGTAADTGALARRFGRSEQGISSLLYRIRQSLRQCIERKLCLEEA
ncbi:MAG: sigma-70 family RNA polymerase sigma factor [Planctomycetaceae bacterium]|nr:sigma-70 family RNA polymerase sigma factor [Planctomycetaceae bacterium]